MADSPRSLIIAGSRDLDDQDARAVEAVHDAFATFVSKHWWPDVILSGMALGADTIGWQLAELFEIPVRAFPVYSRDWSTLGPKAGPLRNQRMVDDAHGLVVVRYPDSRGSADVLRRARKKGIPIVDLVLERRPHG